MGYPDGSNSSSLCQNKSEDFSAGFERKTTGLEAVPNDDFG